MGMMVTLEVEAHMLVEVVEAMAVIVEVKLLLTVLELEVLVAASVVVE